MKLKDEATCHWCGQIERSTWHLMINHRPDSIGSKHAHMCGAQLLRLSQVIHASRQPPGTRVAQTGGVLSDRDKVVAERRALARAAFAKHPAAPWVPAQLL